MDINMSNFPHAPNHLLSQQELGEAYEIIGVVIHSGDPSRGHYYSFIWTNVESN